MGVTTQWQGKDCTAGADTMRGIEVQFVPSWTLQGL
jgi:hypothetical protein